MSTGKKIVRNIFNILFWIVFLAVFFCTGFLLLTRNGAENANFFGYRLAVVLADSLSMEGEPLPEYDIPTVKSKSMLLIKNVPEDFDGFVESLRIGDIVTFRSSDELSFGKVITHRITAIERIRTGEHLHYRIVTRGDNNPADVVEVLTDSTDTGGVLLGKVEGCSLFFGKLYYFVTSPAGLILLVVLPCAALVTVEIVKIVKMCNKKKLEDYRKKILEEIESEKKDDKT